jgi:LCP family protein required for cell wall assembly
VVILAIGGFLLAKGYFQLGKVFSGNGSAVALNTNVSPGQLKGIGSGRVNVLLLGVGGPGHDGPDLTDTIMLASVDPINKKVALISVPRDLWVKEPNNYMSNYGKLNEAYESGKYQYLGRESASNSNQKAVQAGFDAADKVVGRVLGVPVNYNVLVNFKAFSQAVNTVGGVDINVPERLYDPTVAWQNNWNPIIAKKGMQHMNGAKALLYSRSRETSSDFARAKLQRSVMVALKNKILSLGTLSNPWKINKLLGNFGNNVRTDLSLGDTEALYNILKSISNENIKSVGLTDAANGYVKTAMLYGQSIVLPKAGMFDYSDIHDYVRNSARDGYIAEENAKITVLNGTMIDGAASRVADELESYGFDVGRVANANRHNYSATKLFSASTGNDKYTAHYLKQLLNVNPASLDKSLKPNGANFVIIVGSDEATTNR